MPTHSTGRRGVGDRNRRCIHIDRYGTVSGRVRPSFSREVICTTRNQSRIARHPVSWFPERIHDRR